jgi:hypothetical protein
MSAVLDELISDLDPDLQLQMRGRVAAMLRHLQYLRETNSPALANFGMQSWPMERLEIFCELNSFYQIIMAPLASSSRTSLDTFLGAEVPIRYGDSIIFDQSRAERVRRTMRDFMRRMHKIGVPQAVLTAARADDMLRALQRTENQQDSGAEGDEFPF